MEELEEGVSDKYIFYEMPRKCVVTWELILYRALITGAMYFIPEGTAIYPSMRRDKFLDRDRLFRLIRNLSTWLMYHILNGKKKCHHAASKLHELSASKYHISFPPAPSPLTPPSPILYRMI